MWFYVGFHQTLKWFLVMLDSRQFVVKIDMCNADQMLELNCDAFLVGSIAGCKSCSGNVLNHTAEI